MRPGSRDSFHFFCGIILFVIVFTLCAGCIANQIPGIIPADNTKEDPVTGTWNGFSATSGDKNIADPAIIDEVEKIRLNIYPDRSFSYTTNFTIMNGTLVPTGKGNYVVKANDTDTERKYFRFDQDQDILKWESQNMTIEFRRNDQVLTAADLADYNTRMKEISEQEQLAASVTSPTPVPPGELAQIYSRGFGYDPTANIVYQMNGEVHIEGGLYDSVGVILRYPDKDEYQIDVGGMGGDNFTRKEFKLILNDRVINQTPAYFIRLGSTEYPALLSNETPGYTTYTAYSNAT